MKELSFPKPHFIFTTDYTEYHSDILKEEGTRATPLFVRKRENQVTNWLIYRSIAIFFLLLLVDL